MPKDTVAIEASGDSVTIDISPDYFGGGFPWFRIGISFVILVVVYFVGVPRLFAAVPTLATLPHSDLLKYLGVIPLLALFYLLHFMGFYIPSKDGTSYFMSLAFYAPRIRATPQEIVITKRWLLRRSTTRIPVSALKEFNTSPWFQFVSSHGTVTISDGLKAADGKRIRAAIAKVINRN